MHSSGRRGLAIAARSWSPLKASNALVNSVTTVIAVGSHLRGYWTLDGSGVDGAASSALVATGGVTYATGKARPGRGHQRPGWGRLTAPTTGTSYDLAASGFTYECWTKIRSLAYGIDPRIALRGIDQHPVVLGAPCLATRMHDRDGEGAPRPAERQSPVERGNIKRQRLAPRCGDLRWREASALHRWGPGRLARAVRALRSDRGGTFALGARPTGANQFDGLIDEARIWAGQGRRLRFRPT